MLPFWDCRSNSSCVSSSGFILPWSLFLLCLWINIFQSKYLIKRSCRETRQNFQFLELRVIFSFFFFFCFFVFFVFQKSCKKKKYFFLERNYCSSRRRRHSFIIFTGRSFAFFLTLLLLCFVVQLFYYLPLYIACQDV